MLFQLTTAGRALINTNGLLTTIDKVQFGDAYNYTPAVNPTGLTGSLVYQTLAPITPIAVNANSLRFTTYIPAAISAFTFGEVALWSGVTLVGVGALPVPINKAADPKGADYRLDVYVDLQSTQKFASWEVVSSFSRNFFPRLQSPDQLIPPAFDTNNAYVIYGDGDYNSAYLAFSDPSGKWSFSNKSKVWFQGVVDTAGASGIASAVGLANAVYNGTANELVIQFTSGAQQGICRRLSAVNNGTVTWSTAMNTPPQAGDTYAILGPRIPTNFTGYHESLLGLQGGAANDRFHLSQAEHDRVTYPKFKSIKSVAAATYAAADADDDAYIILTNPNVVVTLDDSTFTTFPIGGMIMFRYVNAALTIQVGGTNTMLPFNIVNINTGTGTVAVVRTGAGTWDYQASVSESPSYNGNVRHKFIADGGQLALSRFVPMYAPTGSEVGVMADLTPSRMSYTDTGGLRVWPGSLSADPVWDNPAVILVGISGGPTAGTYTGLPNNSTTYTAAGTVNGVAFSVSMVGSAAQTFSQLLASFNSQLYTSLGSNTIASMTLNTYGLIFSTVAAGSAQTITLTNTNLFDSLQNTVPHYRLTHTGTTGAIDNSSVYANFFDTGTNNNRLYRAGFGAFISGFQNSASGTAGYSLGGAYNWAHGTNSGIIGGTTNRLSGFYCQMVGGYGNVIQAHPTINSAWTPQFSTILSGERSLIQTKSTSVGVNDVPVFNILNAVSHCTTSGSFNSIMTSRYVTSTGSYSVVFGSDTVTISGNSVSVFNSKNVVTGTGSSNSIDGSSNITLTGSNVHVTGVNDLTSDQSNVQYLPNGTASAAGKPGLTFKISTGAYASGANVQLTTNAQSLTSTNAMLVPTGEAWTLKADVIANYPNGYKSWSVEASLKNIAGIVTIASLSIEETGNINASNMTVDFVTGTGIDRNKVHFEVNSRNDTNDGWQLVSCSALATIVAARNLP